MDDFYEKRLRDLEKNITEDQKLLKEYEDSLRYENDPRVIGKYKRESERQRESLTIYQQEFAELKQKLIDNQLTQVLRVESQLQQMDEKINVLLQFNQTQLVLTENLLQALDNNMVSELEMQQMLAVLEERLPSLPPSQAVIAEIIKNPELDARHKLKITLPIIPMLVEYEGELELGSGFNIKSAWQQLIAKLQRK